MLGTRFTRYLILVGVLVAIFAVAVGACGGDDETPAPAPSGVSAEELRQIVSEESGAMVCSNRQRLPRPRRRRFPWNRSAPW